jgi:hypothetical protein
MKNVLVVDPEEFWAMLEEKLVSYSREKEATPTKWLRSADVRKMLNISDSTLQTMRISGALPAYKLGNSWFYKHDEIIHALENGKTKGGAENDR